MPPRTPIVLFSQITLPYICQQCRHKSTKQISIPEPTPFVPDAPTFLTLIGRELSKHASKFPTWSSLFTVTSSQLREMGLEPTRTRRYLLHWREKFRRGEFGIGGDLRYVKDGVAELRVCEVPAIPESKSGSQKPEDVYVSATRSPGMQKLILNVPPGLDTYKLEPGQTTFDLRKPRGMTLRNGHAIAGSYVQPVKGGNGSVATLKVQEGLWEHRRGHKVDGGERRKAEVRFKRRVAERRAASR